MFLMVGSALISILFSSEEGCGGAYLSRVIILLRLRIRMTPRHAVQRVLDGRRSRVDVPVGRAARARGAISVRRHLE